MVAGTLRGEIVRADEHHEGTSGHAEHRDRDRDERKVIPHRHTEDPREQNLVHQGGKCDSEQTRHSRGRRSRAIGDGAHLYWPLFVCTELTRSTTIKRAR